MLRFQHMPICMALVLALPGLAGGQIINDQVRFDTYAGPTNNDLENNFTGTSWIQMLTTGGITGGALLPPDSISWGNDAIRYCKNYVNIVDSLSEASICFLYNSSLVQSSVQQRAVDIWLFSNVANHWIIFSVNYDLHLTINSYSSATDTLLSLVSGHWYRITASYKSLPAAPGDWVYARAEVFDLGTAGTDPPVSVGHETVTFQDADMVQSDLEVKISGARFGGGEMLDDFSYHGIPGVTTCLAAGIHPRIEKKQIRVYPQPATSWLVVEPVVPVRNATLSVYDASGRRILSLDGVMLPYPLDIASLDEGCYFLECCSATGCIRRMFVKGGTE